MLSLFFLNEIWFTSCRAFSNLPFWSLSYEFFYYLIFGAYFYFSGWKKWFFTGIFMSIAGPKILILFPVWLTGVATFHLSKKIKPGTIKALCLIIAPIIIYDVYRDIGSQRFLMKETVELLGRDFVYRDLRWSRAFINDYIVGILVAIHILGIVAIPEKFSFPRVVEKTIRYFAGMTFALYLFHYPLLQFYGSFVEHGVTIFVLTFLSVLLITPLTEGKKRQWRKFINSIFSACTNLLTMIPLPRRK